MNPVQLGLQMASPTTRMFGKWRGIVVQVDEQQDHFHENRQQRGRLRATVPALVGVFGVLPWALPCFPLAGGAAPSASRASDEHGLFYMPRVGSMVWIEFEQGDPSKPIWTGCFYPRRTGRTVGIPRLARGEPDGTEGATKLDPSHSYQVGADGMGADFVRVQSSPSTPDAKGTDFAAKYPFNMIYKSLSGHTVEIDDTKGATRIRIRHRSGSQIQFRHNGDIKVFAAKELHLVAEDRIILKAPEVKAGAGDLLGGVMTSLTQPNCMVTGLPFSFSRSVKANT